MSAFLRCSWLAVVASSGSACTSPIGTDAGNEADVESAFNCTESGLACDTSLPDITVDHPFNCTESGAACDVSIPDSGLDVAGPDSGVDVAPIDTGIDATADVSDAMLESSADEALEGGLASLCTSTGGTLTTGLCCASAGDFPNSCLAGACGCAPSSSHTVMKCLCSAGHCFDAALGCH